jgi:hypothetical protein
MLRDDERVYIGSLSEAWSNDVAVTSPGGSQQKKWVFVSNISDGVALRNPNFAVDLLFWEQINQCYWPCIHDRVLALLEP